MIKPRIIAGEYKNRGLNVPDNARPVTDRVKQQLFDLIQEFIPNASVLDLYAGSGNLGLEALSRGAQNVIFVDNDKEATSSINKNIKNIKVHETKVTVINQEVEKFLKVNKKSFDLVFIDPPFSQHSDLEINLYGKLINPEGLIVLKIDNEQIEKIEIPSNLELVYSKKIGINNLFFLKMTSKGR